MFGKGKISFGKINMPIKITSFENEEKSEVIQNESVGGFGKFGSKSNNDDANAANSEMAQSMGFSSFGKSARSFDLNELVEESKKIAAERKKDIVDAIEEEDENEEGSTRTTRPADESNASDDSDDEDEMIGPPLPPELSHNKNDAEQSDEDDEENLNVRFPVTRELQLNHGSKTVSAMTVDPSGSRLVSGSIDYDVKYWDFQGMDLAKEAFRSFRPSDGYPINSVEYSCTGDKVLVVSGSVQAKVYDRDGVEVYECVRGDMYLHDMAKTKGHNSGLTDGKWHPKNKEEFLTSGRDGTCRIWYTTRVFQQIYVIKPRASNGLKTHPTTCNYSRDGLLVASGCDDGSIQMWDHRKNFVNTSFQIRKAHERGDTISCLSFSYDNKAFATRGEQTLKLWDMRNNKTPIHTKDDLFSRFSMTDCVFSPTDQLVVTGTSKERNDAAGKLKFFDRNTFELVKDMEIGESHVVRVVWHPRLNQIMMGCGDGQIRILYDQNESRNGAIFVAGKHKKRAKQAEVIVSQQIITPHALPLFREERHKSHRKVEEKDRKDPTRSHQPELPIGKTGSGGRVSTGGSTLSSYIIRNMGIRNKVREEGDPREALLKHAKEASDNPYWVSPAYAKTQPNTVFQQPETEAEEEDEPQVKKVKTS
ncbi:UNVERIFIED_CONTAM: hypothetical protein GTU68_041924 [Idotea baltica]|nr:hypothetical protein [Idotea baltica]